MNVGMRDRMWSSGVRWLRQRSVRSRRIGVVSMVCCGSRCAVSVRSLGLGFGIGSTVLGGWLRTVRSAIRWGVGGASSAESLLRCLSGGAECVSHGGPGPSLSPGCVDGSLKLRFGLTHEDRGCGESLCGVFDRCCFGVFGHVSIVP